MARTNALVLTLFIAVVLVAGCTGQSSVSAPNISTDQLQLAYDQLGCHSIDECNSFCAANHETCDAFCAQHADICDIMVPNRPAGKPNVTGAPPKTTCQQDVIINKILAYMGNMLVSPPSSLHEVNWMTKILPSTNPYPGYYYDISCAFGPAVDDADKTGWNGMGEPPLAPGEFHYSFGIWDEISKQNGATLGAETPQSLDFSKYQVAIFYTDKTGSQDAMINALPPLTMSEAQAKEYFYTVIKKSFINLDQKTLAVKGGKFYEVQWHDSEKTDDYWDVQIGEGYINVGQGKVYSAESNLAGNVGTVWKYTGCKPCAWCEEWTKGTALNHDCATNSDCQTGYVCDGGYCILPTAGQTGTPGGPSSQGGPGATSSKGAPGSHCSSSSDCESGLSCTNSVCTAPSGGPPGGAGGPP